jgi:hypothetical protein
MEDLIEKSIALIKNLEALKNVDEKRKEKFINCLKKIVRGNDYVGDLQILQMIKNSDCYISAFYFFQENGKETFQQLCQSTSKGQLIQLFKKHQKSFTDEEYWLNLRDTYILQDFAHLNYKELKKLFLSKRKFREKLMDDEEFKLLKSLPENITIYRGGSIEELKKEFGLSWSLDKKIASKFVDIKSTLTNEKMVVHELIIPKANVIAYINSRQEEEIIYLGN